MFVEDAFEFVAGKTQTEFAVHGYGDGTSLFADDDGDGIGLLGDSECGTVAQSEVLRNAERVTDWQDATYGGDASVGYDHGSVVEGRILEEDVLYEFAVDLGIDGFTGLYDICERHFTFENDECSDEVFRHIIACHDHRQSADILIFIVHILGVKPSEEQGKSSLTSKGKEETTYLLLEYHNQSKTADADQFVEYAAQQFHLEHLRHDNPNKDENEDSVEYIQRTRRFHQSVYLVEQDGYAENVDYIFYSEVKHLG